MNVVFSPRDTGACPLCKKVNRCTIRKDIEKTLSTLAENEKKDMELVIYICPSFIEKE